MNRLTCGITNFSTPHWSRNRPSVMRSTSNARNRAGASNSVVIWSSRDVAAPDAGASKVDHRLEAAVAHALHVEGHLRRVHHLGKARVFHHLGIHAIAVLPRLVQNPGEDH